MDALANLLSLFYGWVPSYAAAITMLTFVVMLVLLPLTIKGTRSMLAMQKLAPEIKKLQDKHKNDRQKLNEEMMALYRDNNIKPLGGCLPLLLQMPVFIVLYQVIVGLTHRADGVVAPKYLDHSSELYRDIVASGGKMESFGMDLGLRASSDHSSFLAALPFYLMIALMVALQYIQMHQVSRRAPANDSPMAQQMRVMQKFFPPIFGLIALSIPAGVVLYWIVSSLFRIAQQWAMYRFDPQLKTTVEAARKEAESFLREDITSGRAQKSQKQGQRSGASKSSNKSSQKKKRKGR